LGTAKAWPRSATLSHFLPLLAGFYCRIRTRRERLAA